METSILIQNLSKSYSLHNDAMPFFALNNINLQIEAGDFVGIIGKNGSGKSTLLKIIAGFIKPSTGSVEIKGKLNSVIEIGSNFIPELTGRENMDLFLSLQKLPKSLHKAKIAEIEKFADLGNYFDQAVKFYSSGMFVRLASAAAFNNDADIFVLDEVLMAGDQLFREKINVHLQDLKVKNCTLLLASHNPKELLHVCNKGIYLNNGSVEFVGSIQAALACYEESLAKERSELKYTIVEQNYPNTVEHFNEISKEFLENENIRLEELKIIANKNAISYQNGFSIELKFHNKNLSRKIHPLFKIYNAELSPILLLISSNEDEVYQALNNTRQANIRLLCHFPEKLLSGGIYYLEFMAGENPQENQIHTKEAFLLKIKLKFKIENSSFDFTGATQNVFIKPSCKWEIFSNE